MILVVDCGSKKTGYICDIVDNHTDFERVGILDLTEEFVAKADGVIFSGAPILITEIDTSPYLEKVQWIKETKIPVLGICFGHQIIGLLHGAMGNRSTPVRDWQTIERIESCALFDKLPQQIEMREDRCESISVPPGFELVASSDACINECMQHREKLIFGVQFHPEVSGNHGAVILENFIGIAKKINK